MAEKQSLDDLQPVIFGTYVTFRDERETTRPGLAFSRPLRDVKPRKSLFSHRA